MTRRTRYRREIASDALLCAFILIETAAAPAAAFCYIAQWNLDYPIMAALAGIGSALAALAVKPWGWKG